MNRRKRLGQHFLIDRGVARAIAAALPDIPARVLEVGPGTGALTRELLARFSRVVALEIDRSLAARLAASLGRPNGLTVIEGDALEFDLERLTGSEPWLVAGNLPYSVATPIIRRFLRSAQLFPAAVFMVQEEVARRLVAPPGDRARGVLTLEVEGAARAEVVCRVRQDAFAPRPKVLSAVVRLTAQAPPFPLKNLAAALTLASVAFQHRRKKLANAIEGELPRQTVMPVLERCRIDAGARAEDLALAQWVDLSSALRSAGGVS